MGKQVFKDAFIEVDGVDLSNHFNEITLESQFDEQDATGFGSNYREIALGLGDATISGTVLQDFDAASVDATLWPLHESGHSFPVLVRPKNQAASATNPEYAMTSVLPTYNPIAGAVGDMLTSPVTFRNASQDGLTKTGGDS